jgi:ABC-type transport system involved in multi-copper enzyme maturation permease subunit
MTDPIFWRLVWKEYRTMRSFWLCLAGFGVMLMPLYRLTDSAMSLELMRGIITMLPAFYLLGSTAVSFAAEREDGTNQALYRLGASRGRLWSSKLGSVLVSTALMFGLLWLVGYLAFSFLPFRLGPNLDEVDRGLSAIAWGVAFLGWGVFFSLVCRSVLSALCLTVAASLLTPFATDAVMRLLFGVLPDTYPPALDDQLDWCFRLAVLPALLLIESYRLTQLWANDRGYRLPGWIVRPWNSISRRVRSATSPWSVTSQTAVADATAPRVRPLTRELGRPWRRELKRLLWLEWKSVKPVAGATLAAGLALMMGLSFTEWDTVVVRDVPILLMVLSPLVFGLWSYQGEQRGQQFLCLTHQGLSPSKLWLTKNLVWFVMALLVSSAFVLAAAARFNLHSFGPPNATKWLFLPSPGSAAETRVWYLSLIGNLQPLWKVSSPASWPQPVLPAAADGWGRFMLVVLLSYSIGHLTSLLIARTITSVFVGFSMWGLIAVWWGLATHYELPLLFSVVPLILTLLLTTWVYVSDWMTGRRDWRVWIKLALVFNLPIAMMLAWTVWFRVHEIPTTPRIVELTTRPELSISAEAVETGKLLRQAAQSLGNWSEEPKPGHKQEVFRFPPHPHTITEWQPIDPNSKRWVDENQRVLAKTIELVSRADCAFDETYLVDSHIGIVAGIIADIARLGYLLRASAWQLESEDRLDEAFERHLLNLRLASLCGRHAGSYQALSVVWMEKVAITGMARWAAHPRHTTSTLSTALEKLQVARTTLLPDPRNALAVDHLVFSNQLASESTDVSRNLLKSLCPWERARAQRLLDYQSIADLDEVAPFATPAHGLNLSEEFRNRTHRLAGYLYGLGHDSFLDRWERATPLLSGFVDTSLLGQLVAHRLDAQARLHALGLTIALTAYKQEHGHYPARLDELPDPIYQAFANDPWTGRPLDYRPVGFRADVVHPYFNLAAKRPVLQSCGMLGLPLDQPGRVVVVDQRWNVLFTAGWSDSSAVAAGNAVLIFPLP